MNSVWKVAFLGLLVTTSTSAEDPTGQVLDYVTSLILYLSNQEPGSFDCWFYENSKQPSMDTVLNAIVSSHRLSLISRRVLYSEGKVEVQRSPGALIIVVNGNQFMKIALFLTSSFDRGLKVVVLHNNDNLEGFIYIVEALRVMQLHNVVYIFTDYLVIQNLEAFQKISYTRTGTVPFHEVFIDPTSNLTGRTFHLSLSSSILWNSDAYNGYSNELFSGTIQRHGGRAEIHSIDCVQEISIRDCFLKSLNYNSTTTYDFGVNTLSNPDITNEFYMHSIVPIPIQIAAPSGRKLTLFDVFMIPFQLELWAFLLTLFVTSALLIMFFLLRFQNNLILLPLCGFEKSSFHQVSSLEKTILTVLIVIYFVLTTAYEAKISAFMTNFPYAPDPRTLDDLLVTGITVEQTDENFLTATIEHNPRIKKLFSKIEFNESRKGDWYSRNHAYIGSRSHFYSCLNDPQNFDPETGRRRMVVLDQFTLGIRVGFFFTSYRNPVVPKLQRAEFQFFEGGFTHFWLQQITRQHYGARHVDIVAKGYNIGFYEMEPAWYAIVAGWVLGVIVFVAEIIYSKIIHNSTQQKMYGKWLCIKRYCVK